MSWNLPPLPQRTHGFDAEPLYTAEQMRAYAADALEAQAKRIAELDAALLELLSVAPAKAPAAGILVGIEARHRNAIDRARAALAPKESGDD